MQDLDIEAGRDTLGVHCDAEAGLVRIWGVSYPQNASEFFAPVLDWLSRYLETVQGPVTLDLRISYLNTCSTKCLFDLMDSLVGYAGGGREARVKWRYEADDEDMRETGAEFAEDIDLPFELIPC